MTQGRLGGVVLIGILLNFKTIGRAVPLNIVKDADPSIFYQIMKESPASYANRIYGVSGVGGHISLKDLAGSTPYRRALSGPASLPVSSKEDINTSAAESPGTQASNYLSRRGPEPSSLFSPAMLAGVGLLAVGGFFFLRK